MLEVYDPITPDDFADVRRLAWAFRDLLASLPPPDDVVTTFAYDPDSYGAILKQLETKHTAPNGALKLARLDGVPVGCGMLQTFSPGVGEVKRVYVSDSARGSGAGRAVMKALIKAAHELGYTRLLLDTGRPLVAAQNLYLSLGFKERCPYWDAPPEIRDRLIFYERSLKPEATA